MQTHEVALGIPSGFDYLGIGHVKIEQFLYRTGGSNRKGGRRRQTDSHWNFTEKGDIHPVDVETHVEDGVNYTLAVIGPSVLSFELESGNGGFFPLFQVCREETE
jgi:hypothetical protein